MQEGIGGAHERCRITAFDTQSNDSTATIKRYQDGYRVADTVVTFGEPSSLAASSLGAWFSSWASSNSFRIR